LPPPPPPPIPPNREAFEARLPKAGLAEKAIGIGRAKRQESYEEIREAYQKAVQDYQIKTQEREQSIERDKAFYARKVQERQLAIQDLEAQLQAKNRELVEQYFQLVLEKSEYPEGFPAKQCRLSYNPETCELVLEYDLPQYDPIIPAFKGYKYIKTSDKIEGIALSQTDERKMQELYEEVIAAVALGTLHELFAADHIDTLAIVTFNGMANTVDKATGKDIRPCLVSVQASKEDFLKLNLARVDKKACLKHLKAQTSPSSKELVPVKPLVDLVTTDSRFVKEANVLSQLDSRLNLLTMSPGDFEHLIANLFTSMGFKTGTTRLSNDGGVDVIAFDERPLMGGKIIIQAKRYRNTVDVESVRALYGVMQDEGATKGILVTTSSFGKASREFVVGKPIELVDGNALLYYLEQQGYKAKIELSKK
jgi:restriction system protein